MTRRSAFHCIALIWRRKASTFERSSADPALIASQKLGRWSLPVWPTYQTEHTSAQVEELKQVIVLADRFQVPELLKHSLLAFAQARTAKTAI
jgi:alpha-mannosidase